MKYIIDLPENKEVCISDGQYTRIIQPDQNKMVVFNCDDDILRFGFTVKLTPYEESDTAEEQGWELARAIRKMDDPDIEEAFSVEGWTRPIDGVLEMIEYAEAKAKYDAWQKLKDELQIGDEVMHDTYRRCVLLEKKDVCEAELWSVIDEKGVVHQINRKHIHRKTGRTFPEIADLLEKMRNPDVDH